MMIMRVNQIKSTTLIIKKKKKIFFIKKIENSSIYYYLMDNIYIYICIFLVIKSINY